MIYLENTTQSQQVYIPRQVIQTATTREINIITSGDVINMIDSKLEPYYTSAETDTQIENAVAAESARCEETYAKISDIPDVSDFITSGDAQEQINQSLDGYATEQWVEDKHYLTEHQSLSAYSTTEEMNEAIDAAVAAESARSENTYAKTSDIPDVSDFVTSGQVKNQVEEYHYVNSGDVKSQIEDYDYATQQWVEDKHYLTEHQSLSAYTKTSDFATINGSGITNGGNLVIEGGGAEYTAGENINIDENNVISVTGITIPDVSNFITSADAQTQIEEYHYVNSGEVKTQIEEYKYVNSAETKTQIEGYNYTTSGEVETQINDKHFVTSGAVNTQISDAIAAETARTEETYAKPADIPDVTNFVTSAQVETQITDKNYVNSGQVKTQIEDYHYITSSDLPDVSDFVTSADVQTQINDNLSAYTKTNGFATINGSAITEGGNIVIEGGGGSSYTAGDGIDITNDVISVTGRQETLVSGTNIKTINNQSLLGSGNIDIQGGSGNIELTQAEYNALSAYQQDALYVISDAEEVDLNDYATSADLATKADKVTVTANSSMKFPAWNNQGIITGISSNVYNYGVSINGSGYNFLRDSSGNVPNIFAPTTVGSQGQPLISNGSGAPVWASFKFWFGTETQYNAITTKDSSTIYFVKPD